MEDEKKKITFNSKLIEFNLIEFSLVPTINELPFDVNMLAYGFTFNATINPTEGLFTVSCLVEIFTDNSKSTLLGKIQTSGSFHILNFSEFLKSFDVNVPTNIVSMFMGMILSTTRGVLFEKSKGTPIEGALIPMVNTNALFSNSEKITNP